MPGFSRRPLAALFCCLFAGAQGAYAEPETPVEAVEPVPAVAAEAGAAAPASDEPGAPAGSAAAETERRLRVERRFNIQKKKKVAPQPFALAPPVQIKPDDSVPLFIVADHLAGRADESTEAEGNVELRKAGMLLFADRAVYYPLDDEIDARGNVRLLQEGTEIDTPHLRMRLSEQIGFAETVNYRVVQEVTNRLYDRGPGMVFGTGAAAAASSAAAQPSSSAHMMLNVPGSYGLPVTAALTRPSVATGEAERLDFEGERRLRLTKATYSTCEPGDRDWVLKAKELALDYNENRGEAKDASVWFKDVPIAYTPIGDFSLNRQRKSGFLHPTFASSTRNGFDLNVPYYWNIAPNYDAVFYPRYMSKRGFQLGSEVRYLDHNYSGELRGEYMPSDEITGHQRYAYSINHRQNLGRGVSALINWNAVSDDTYWVDLSSRLMQTTAVQLPRHVVLSAAPATWLQANVQVLRYQTLQVDPANPAATVARPYFIEPQINVSGFVPNFMKTDVGYLAQYTRFTHPTQVQGDRMLFYPQISLPILSPSFHVTPKIGLHMTQYQLGNQAAGLPDHMSRVLPTFSLDASVAFERDISWAGRDFIQTLEPRLFYVNIPYRDQSRIPVFDTALSDFNFGQIFAENRYVGSDRINDANQLTAGLTSRLIDGDTGSELFKAMVGQRYYFSEQRVTLNSSEVVRNNNFSNLVVGATGLLAPKTYFDSAWEYDYHRRQGQRLAAGVRYQPDYGRVLSASYRYTRDPLTQQATVDQVDIAGQWPLAPRWFGVARYNYSLSDSRALETIAGLEYNAGCWAVRAVAQRLEAVAGTPNTSIFLQLELSDFGSVGSNPIQLLRRTIPGYGKTNELPATSGLLNNE